MMGKTMRFALIALAIAFTATAGLGQGRTDGVIGLTDGEMDQLTAGSATTIVQGWGSAVGSQAGTFTSALVNGLQGMGRISERSQS